MHIEPIITERSLDQAKDGKYTFNVDNSLNKHQIKELVEKVFDVSVANVRTIQIKGREKMSIWGRKKKIMPAKKAIVTLKGKDTIDIFESKE